MNNFIIKHASGGKFVHPHNGEEHPANGTHLVLDSHVHERMHFNFIPVENEWGYIEHDTSKKIIHPYGGSVSPGNHTQLILHSDRHYGALFAIDTNNGRIVHKGGRFIHPHGGSPHPGNGVNLILHDGVHDAMKFVLVDPRDTTREFDVYKKDHVNCHWKLLRCIKNPKATHEYALEYTIGKSKSESRSSSVEMKWEKSIDATIKYFKMHLEKTYASMLSATKSSTWSTSTKCTQKMTVLPGKTVATWQFVFAAKHSGREIFFESNIFEDTESDSIQPDITQ